MIFEKRFSKTGIVVTVAVANGGQARHRRQRARNRQWVVFRVLPSVGSISRSSLRSNVRMAFDSMVISSLS